MSIRKSVAIVALALALASCVMAPSALAHRHGPGHFRGQSHFFGHADQICQGFNTRTGVAKTVVRVELAQSHLSASRRRDLRARLLTYMAHQSESSYQALLHEHLAGADEKSWHHTLMLAQQSATVELQMATVMRQGGRGTHAREQALKHRYEQLIAPFNAEAKGLGLNQCDHYSAGV